MIERAIGELSKEGLDPIEESISDFIRKEYNNDLPWAHSKMLQIHLRKLCKSGSIIRTKRQHYLLAPPHANLTFGKDCQKRKSRKDLEIPPGFETLENPSQERLEMKSVAASRSKQGQTKIRIRIPAVKPSSSSSFQEQQEIIDKYSDSSACPAAAAASDTSKRRKVKSLTKKTRSEHKVFPEFGASNFEESSGLTMKQAILDVQERRQKELNKFSRLLRMHIKHPPEKRASQNLSNRVSRPWLFSSPVPHSHHEQQQ